MMSRSTKHAACVPPAAPNAERSLVARTTRLRGIDVILGGALVALGGSVAGRRTRAAGQSEQERNKQVVVAYYTLAFNEHRPAEAVARYGGPYYIQHNPLLPDGFEAFIAFVTGFAAQFPQSSVEIRTVLAEGDRVVTHGLLKSSPEDRGTVAMDIFRLEGGKIVEHWDVLQPFPETSANDHPMF